MARSNILREQAKEEIKVKKLRRALNANRVASNKILVHDHTVKDVHDDKIESNVDVVETVDVDEDCKVEEVSCDNDENKSSNEEVVKKTKKKKRKSNKTS